MIFSHFCHAGNTGDVNRGTIALHMWKRKCQSPFEYYT